MPAQLTNIQLGYLKRLVWWINSEAIRNPFTVKLSFGEAIFEKYKKYPIQSTWKTLFQDFHIFADHGYLYIIESDGQTTYNVTPAGLEAGKWT